MTVNIDKQWFLDRMDEQGLSLSKVARQMGIDKSALSRALDGKRQIKLLEVDKIATALAVTREEVIDHGASTAKNATAGKEDRQRKSSRTDTAPPDRSRGTGDDAGFETEPVDTTGERLGLRRAQKSVPEGRSASSGATGPKRRPLHPGIGFMKGLIKIQPGFDVTGPFSDELWDDGYLGEDRLPEGYIGKAQK